MTCSDSVPADSGETAPATTEERLANLYGDIEPTFAILLGFLLVPFALGVGGYPDAARLALIFECGALVVLAGVSWHWDALSVIGGICLVGVLGYAVGFWFGARSGFVAVGATLGVILMVWGAVGFYQDSGRSKPGG